MVYRLLQPAVLAFISSSTKCNTIPYIKLFLARNRSYTQCHQSFNFLHNTVTHVPRPIAIRVAGGIDYKMKLEALKSHAKDLQNCFLQCVESSSYNGQLGQILQQHDVHFSTTRRTHLCLKLLKFILSQRYLLQNYLCSIMH